MNRRDTIKSLGLISTHALLPTILSGFIAGCNDPSRRSSSGEHFFNENEMKHLKEVIDEIIPATSTASASEAGVHLFLDEVFAKCLTADQQSLIREGFKNLISSMSAADSKTALLIDVDRRAFSNDEDAAYFLTIKQYTLVGFFTSQEGATKASNYVKFPGDYQGEIPLDENTLNYATTDMRYYL